MILNTKEDKLLVSNSYLELYENEFFTVYEENIEGVPFIHTLIYKFTKDGVVSWVTLMDDLAQVYKEEGKDMMCTNPYSENTAVVRVAQRAKFVKVCEDGSKTLLVRYL